MRSNQGLNRSASLWMALAVAGVAGTVQPSQAQAPAAAPPQAVAPAPTPAETAPAPATDVPMIPFTSVADPLKLPGDIYFGEVAGVAVNAKKHVFVFSRGNTTGAAYGASAAQLLEFDQTGKFVREIGHNLYAWGYAHAVKIDPQQNIWVADKGTDMVVKFTPEGKVSMVFGRRQEASDDGTGPLKHVRPALPAVAGLFRQVTDMAWGPDGTTYISDGYINSRVAIVSHDGDWMGSFGGPGSGPSQFNTPHSIATDAAGNVYVADRGNRRIQVFDGKGNFERQMTIDVAVDPAAKPILQLPPRPTGPPPPPGAPLTVATGLFANGTFQSGSPWAICITPPPHQVLYSADAFPGRIYKLSLDGKVLGMLGSSGRTLGKFAWIHEMACPSENELWVADLLNWRVQKLELHPAH